MVNNLYEVNDVIILFDSRFSPSLDVYFICWINPPPSLGRSEGQLATCICSCGWSQLLRQIWVSLEWPTDRNSHSRVFLSQRLSILRAMWPAHCKFNLYNFTATSMTFLLFFTQLSPWLVAWLFFMSQSYWVQIDTSEWILTKINVYINFELVRK